MHQERICANEQYMSQSHTTIATHLNQDNRKKLWRFIELVYKGLIFYPYYCVWLHAALLWSFISMS